jgi:hypothetical protein
MKRAMLNVALAALCVAGSAVAQDRSGGLIGSGTRAEDGGQTMGSGNAAGQTVGSGGFTISTQDQVMGSGGRTENDGQVLGSGGLIGSGTRAENSGQVIGSGGGETNQDGGYLGNGGRSGYLGSGLSVRELRLWDGSSLLVVSSDEGMFIIPIEE